MNNMEEIDTTLFAGAIHQRRALWDTKCQEYKDRRCKRDSWIEVARAVYRNYDTLSQKEKDDAGQYLTVFINLKAMLPKLVMYALWYCNLQNLKCKTKNF